MISSALTSSSTGLSKEEAKVKLKEVSQEFESLFYKMYLEKSMTMDNSLFGKGTGSEIYNAMYVDTLSHAVSGGIGISQMIYEHLEGTL